MCGIVGYLSYNRFKNNELLASLSHRGPDDEGVYCDQVHDKNIFLGHKRLSILDLTKAGHQPMFSKDKNIVIIYNGEVYNYLELKKKYLADINFNSNSDTEVILNLYLKLGEKFVCELNGDFAIAILDKRKNILLIYRDRLGVKPVYYYLNSNTFFFASELKPFIKAGLNKGLSQEELMNYFVFKYVPQNNTLFKGIYRVAPGCYLKVNNEILSVEINRYWDPSYETDYSISFNDAKKQIFILLKDAVEKRLISDVPVGTLFSGGVDSSSIAYFLRDKDCISHYTAKKNKCDIKEEGTTSDFEYASKLAKEWKLNLKQIDIGIDQLNLKLVNLTNYYSDDLIADGSQIPSYLISKEASKESTVLLSGMGSDEIFLGYGSHLLTLISQYIDKAPYFIKDLLIKSLSKTKSGRGYYKGYKRFLKKMGKYYYFPYYKYGLYSIVGDFENSFKVMNCSNEPSINVFKSYFNAESDPFLCLQKYELDNFLVKNLNYFDRMCMANGVEGRVPFMDHRLVEFVLTLPRSFKLSNFGKQKVILKSAFEGKIPNFILHRRKAGFGMPLRSIFKNGEHVVKMIDYDFLSSFHYFNLEHINKLIDNHTKGLEDNSTILYSIISFQSWYKTHIT